MSSVPLTIPQATLFPSPLNPPSGLSPQTLFPSPFTLTPAPQPIDPDLDRLAQARASLIGAIERLRSQHADAKGLLCEQARRETAYREQLERAEAALEVLEGN